MVAHSCSPTRQKQEDLNVWGKSERKKNKEERGGKSELQGIKEEQGHHYLQCSNAYVENRKLRQNNRLLLLIGVAVVYKTVHKVQTSCSQVLHKVVFSLLCVNRIQKLSTMTWGELPEVKKKRLKWAIKCLKPEVYTVLFILLRNRGLLSSESVRCLALSLFLGSILSSAFASVQGCIILQPSHQVQEPRLGDVHINECLTCTALQKTVSPSNGWIITW